MPVLHRRTERNSVLRKDPEGCYIEDPKGNGAYCHLAMRRTHKGQQLVVEGGVEREPEPAEKAPGSLTAEG